MADRVGSMEPEEVTEEEVETVTAEESEEDEVVNVESAEDWDTRAMDPDEVLWEGGPTIAQINAWKDRYGEVYFTAVTMDKNIVWRTLNRAEYREITRALEAEVRNGNSQTESMMDNEEAIAELCILWPKYDARNAGNELAGIAYTISSHVMEASAFSPLEIRQL